MFGIRALGGWSSESMWGMGHAHEVGSSGGPQSTSGQQVVRILARLTREMEQR